MGRQIHTDIVTLHKEFIAENHHHYTIHNYVIHFIFFNKQKYPLQLLHEDRHSSVSWLFKFFRYVPSSAQHMKNRVNGSIYV